MQTNNEIDDQCLVYNIILSISFTIASTPEKKPRQETKSRQKIYALEGRTMITWESTHEKLQTRMT